MAKGWAAQSINFLIGIARRRHHSQARNSPWTMFSNGVRRHQKANGRSLPCAIWRRAVSPPTGGPDPRSFFSTSRSMRVQSRSRFSRAISAAWSAGEGSGGTPAATARERAAPVWTAARQFRSIDGELPTSVATCINGRALLSSSATASRLNSGANSRLVLVIQSPFPLNERIKGVHRSEGPSMIASPRFPDSATRRAPWASRGAS